LVLPYLAGNCEKKIKSVKLNGSCLWAPDGKVDLVGFANTNISDYQNTRVWRDLAGIVREVSGSTRGTLMPWL